MAASCSGVVGSIDPAGDARPAPAPGAVRNAVRTVVQIANSLPPALAGPLADAMETLTHAAELEGRASAQQELASLRAAHATAARLQSEGTIG